MAVMSFTDDVSFEADQGTPTGASRGTAAAESKMAAWLMRRGVAKSQNQAQYILLGIAGAAIMAGIIGWFALQSSGPAPYSPQQIQSMMQSSSRPPAPAAAHTF